MEEEKLYDWLSGALDLFDRAARTFYESADYYPRLHFCGRDKKGVYTIALYDRTCRIASFKVQVTLDSVQNEQHWRQPFYLGDNA